MADVTLFFLPGIITLGIITSYEDIRYSRIMNRWLVLAFAYALIINGLLILFAIVNIGITELLTNFLFSATAGFGLWYFGLWSAGDGKLFIAFSLLLPLQEYVIGYVRWLPSITLLVNTFIPALAFLLGSMLFRLRLKHIRKDFRSTRYGRVALIDLVKSLPGLFVMFWLMQALLSISSLGRNYLLTILLTLIAFSAVQKALSGRAAVIMALFSISRFFLDKTVYTLQFWMNFAAAILIWGIASRFVQERLVSLGRTAFSREIAIENLREDMYLGEIICRSKKKPTVEHVRHKGLYYFRAPKTRGMAGSFIDSDSLTSGQIDIIRRIGFKKVRVSETMPFAMFIFIGVLLTLVVKGNILIFLNNLM